MLAVVGLGQCAPARAVPLSRWGLALTPFTAAVEAELRLPESPWGVSSRLGAAGLPYVRSSEMGIEASGNWWTTWGHHTHPVTSQVSIGGLVGVSKSWFFRGAPIPFRSWYNSQQPVVAFAGASVRQDWGGVWLCLTPSLTFSPEYPAGQAFDFWEASVLGPPLVEVGLRVDERSEWRFRTSLTPVAYLRTF